MRIISMFYTSVFWVTVLTFSAPFVVLAQQDLGQTEIAAAKKVDAMLLTAITAAESDARGDINRLACLSAGASIAIIGGTCGALYIDGGFIETGSLRAAAFIGSFAMGVGIFAALVGTNSYLPNPSPEKLIGKSPEYVRVYAEAYRKKTLALGMKSVVTGAVIGGSGCVMLSLVLFPTASYDYPE